MKIFLFYRDNWYYDQDDSLVIKAFNIEKAKEIASKHDWGDWKYNEEEVKIKEIDLYDCKDEVILSSFNAG